MSHIINHVWCMFNKHVDIRRKYAPLYLLTSPLIRTQSSVSLEVAGLPYSQLVKVTVEESLQSNSPSILMSLSPIQSSSVDAADIDSDRWTSCKPFHKQDLWSCFCLKFLFFMLFFFTSLDSYIENKERSCLFKLVYQRKKGQTKKKNNTVLVVW